MDRSKGIAYPLILVAALLLGPTSAFADPMGSDVTITRYYPDLATTIPGLDPSRVSTGADYIRVHMSGLSYTQGQDTFTLDLHSSDEEEPVVPEPGTMGLLPGGLAVAGLGSGVCGKGVRVADTLRFLCSHRAEVRARLIRAQELLA